MCLAPLLCVLLCAAAAAEPQDEPHVTAAVPASPVAPEAAETTQTKAPNQIHQTISVDDIPKCHRNDSNLDDCLKDAIEKALTMLAAGNVQLGVPGLHPLKLDNIDIHNPKKQLHLIMRDVEIFGIANSTVHKIEPMMKNHQVTCWARSPLLVMTGKYKLLMNLDGQSVGGNGRFTMTFKNLGSRNHMSAVPNRYGHYDESVRPDDYVGVIFTGTLSDVSHVHLDFENLFYGGKMKAADYPTCKRSDADLGGCLQRAFSVVITRLAPGIPALGVVPMDPLHVPAIQISEGSRNINLNINFTDVRVSGLTRATVLSASADLSANRLACSGLEPHIVFEADYKMAGKFLVVPVEGSGKCRIAFTNMTANLGLEAELEQRSSESSFWKVTRFPVDMRGLDLLEVQFDNLFNSDATLGPAFNTLLNDNWKEFWSALRPTFEETFGLLFQDISNKIFQKVPLEEIFPK